MIRKKGSRKKNVNRTLVTFDYENTSYIIDKVNGKVYKKWIEVEKAKEFAILAAWKNSQQFA